MIAAIILAAGESRRMGTQKALLPFADGTVLSHIVDQFSSNCIDAVYVVVGHAPEGIAASLASRPVTLVHNPAYRNGMLSSVRCGLRALPPGTHWVCVALGDQPAVATPLIDALVAACTRTTKRIVVPTFGGRRGHPLLFSSTFRDEILTRYDDQGLRGLLHAHPDEVKELPVDVPGVLEDLDLPEDYQRARAAMEHIRTDQSDRDSHSS